MSSWLAWPSRATQLRTTNRYSPGLLAKNISHKDDPQIEIKLSEFLAEAWRAANDKARELDWIV